MSAGPIVDLAQFQSVLLVKPSSLGDIVHTLPAARFIKRAYPHLKLRWVCNPEWMPILEGNADLAEVIPFPRREFRGPIGMAKFFMWARRLNAAERELPEITLDFQGLMRSALVSIVRGSDPVIGLSDAREGAANLYRGVVRVEKRQHAVDRYLTLVRALGVPASEDGVEFPLPEGLKPKGATLPSQYLVLHPFSRGQGKSLDATCIQALCDCLAPRPIVIVGQSKSVPQISGSHVTCLANQTNLQELIWVLRHAYGCISVDSGPMHIAAALLPRTLGIHTWSDPQKVGPYPASAVVLKAGRIASRNSFTETEREDQRLVETGDMRRIADYVIREWYQA